MKRIQLVFLLLFQFFSCFFVEKAESFDNSQVIFELLYISNLNGSLENCGCGYPPLGGVDRIVSVINQKRGENSHLLFIDGGDFLNTYPFKALNGSMADAYKYLDPDVLVLGDQEFVEGPEFMNKMANDLKESIVASNYTIRNIKLQKNLVFESPSGIKMRFYAYLDPASFDFIKSDGSARFDMQKFDSLYSSIKKEEISVVIYHGTSAGLKSFLDKYSNFDMILFSHEQNLEFTHNSKPPVIGGGADGKSVVDIRVVDSGTDIEFHVLYIPIGLDIKPDSAVSDIIHNYKNHLH